MVTYAGPEARQPGFKSPALALKRKKKKKKKMRLWAIYKSSANPNVLVCKMEATIALVAAGVKMMHV